MDWKKLQNGSDIRGVALDGKKGETVNLTSDTARILGMSLMSWLKQKGFEDIRIAVGMDSRISGPDLKEAFSEGIIIKGGDVYDCGLASTPAMFMTTLSPGIKATAGVMLTASHLPFNRNGFKFFTDNGGFNKKDISEILEISASEKFGNTDGKGEIFHLPFMDEYSEYLVRYIRQAAASNKDYEHPLKDIKIVVDAGNGAGGFFAQKVLKALGADVSGSQFLDPDGMFPNHIPNPEDGEAMESICRAVIRHKADLGIIFDTDVDRAAVVDQSGRPVNRNDLIALISAVVLRERPGTMIVTDSITSTGLTEFIENKLGGVHHRFKRGYKNVINEALRLNEEGQECHLAIETSGHAALKDNHFLDDGAYLVAKLLVEMARMKVEGKYLTDHIKDLRSPVESAEFRFRIMADNFIDYGNKVILSMAERINEIEGWSLVSPNYEGIRVNCENEKGWFLLRLSLHDPVMPLNVESDVEGGIGNILSGLKEILIKYSHLDTSEL